MPHINYFILMGSGGLCLIVGLVTLVRGRRKEKGYYNSLPSRVDVREFLEHSSMSPGYETLKTGGLIATVVGAVLLALGGIFSLLD